MIAAKEYVNMETNQECFIEGTAIDYIVKKIRERKVEEIRREGNVLSFKLLCEEYLCIVLSEEQVSR